jgi:hypothetical protein
MVVSLLMGWLRTTCCWDWFDDVGSTVALM